MKKLFLTICLLGSHLAAMAHAPHQMVADAAQAEVKNAYKAVVNVITYRPDGTVLHTGTGVFLDEAGTCAASYTLFDGAARADVIDFKGNKLAVHRILGANSTYDLVKFTTVGSKENEFFVTDSSQVVPKGTALNMLRYTTKKKEKPTVVSVVRADAYNRYKYFHTTAANIEQNFGCPLVDTEGHLVAFVQQNVEKDSAACAIDARFLNELVISTTSGMNSDLRAIHIPKALPAQERDALTYIYMMGNGDSIAAITALNDFIEAYPDNAEGYTNRGAFYAERKQYALCEQDFAVALEKAAGEKSTIKADEVHNELSKIIFQKAVYAPEPAYGDWNLDRSFREAEQAYALKPVPFYLLQQGRSLFADKKYGEAHEKFLRLATTKGEESGSEWSDVAQTEAWFYAARSLELAGGDSLRVIALLDSALSKCPKPYGKTAAQYFLERAQRLQRAGMFRRAVADYNEYEKIIGTTNLNSQFYYIREQAELECRMYQQALDDIRTAIARNPAEPLYRIEEALVLLRAGLFKDAIAVCETMLKEHPDAADCYKIMGIAYGELGQKSKARTALEKAKEMGDATAGVYLQKYK